MLYSVFSSDIDMSYLILDMLLLDTWYLTLDIWHVILDSWYMTPVLDMLYLTPDTWHLIYDTWRLTYYHSFDMLSHGTSTLDTWYCDTWLDTITPDTCITWHIHDYHFYGDLAWLLYCYQTSCTPKLLNSCTLELLYPLYSCPLYKCLVSGWRGCIPRSC